MKKILIIDDDPVRLGPLGDFMRGKGNIVTAYSDLYEGLEFFENESVDMVFLDVNIVMPGLSGLDTLRDMTAIMPSIPVYIISGYNSDDLIHDCKKLGV